MSTRTLSQMRRNAHSVLTGRSEGIAPCKVMCAEFPNGGPTSPVASAGLFLCQHCAWGLKAEFFFFQICHCLCRLSSRSSLAFPTNHPRHCNLLNIHSRLILVQSWPSHVTLRRSNCAIEATQRGQRPRRSGPLPSLLALACHTPPLDLSSSVLISVGHSTPPCFPHCVEASASSLYARRHPCNTFPRLLQGRPRSQVFLEWRIQIYLPRRSSNTKTPIADLSLRYLAPYHPPHQPV